MELQELREMTLNQFSRHWELNDRGHRSEHFAAVERCGLLVNERLDLGFDPRLIFMVSWFHDLFAWDREKHHELSAYWFLTSEHEVLRSFTRIERELMSHACREHRSSYVGEYTTDFSQLMAAADRGIPGNIEGMIDRAVKYRLDKGIDLDDPYGKAVAHVKEKFGRESKARFPDFYRKAFAAEIEEQHRLLDLL